MESLNEYIDDFKIQLEKGTIQKAYQGLIKYIMDLRTYFNKNYPESIVSGSIYHGIMDMTFFTFTPKSLKPRKAKIAIVFKYDSFQFEIWLTGYNKQIQSEYWKLFKESGWNKYPIVSTTKGVDAIVETVLVENPDFSDLDKLTSQIETGTLKFTADIESFLSQHEE